MLKKIFTRLLLFSILLTAACTSPIVDTGEDEDLGNGTGDNGVQIETKGSLQVDIVMPDSYIFNLKDEISGTIKVVLSRTDEIIGTVEKDIDGNDIEILFEDKITGLKTVSCELSGNIASYFSLSDSELAVIIEEEKTVSVSLELIQKKVTPLQFSYADGKVDIETYSSGSEIYYSIDGSIPNKKSILYSGSINLPDGSTNIKAIAYKTGMLSSDVKTKTYIYCVENNAYLMDINLSNGILSQEFNPDVTTYTVTVDNAVSSIVVTPVLSDENASFEVFNGDDSTEGTCSLTVGDNSIKIRVTSVDKEVTRDYNIIVKRAKKDVSNDALLSNVVFSQGALSPVFSSNIVEYTLKVSDTVTEISANISKNNAASQYILTKDTQNITTENIEIDGDCTLTFTVTAEDEVTEKVYTFNVEIVKDLKLSSLSVSDGELSPLFDSEITSYTVSVKNSVNELTVMAVASGCLININSMESPALISLEEGYNPVSIVLTDNEDSGNSKVYSIIINRKKDAGNSIILHAKDYTYLWAWDDDKNDLFEPWPGKEMTDEGNDWYGWTIADTADINLLFSKPGSGQTGDMSREAGEWWYMDGDWTDYNPELPVIPVVESSVKPGLYKDTQSIELTSSNGVSDTIYYTLDGSVPDTDSLVYTGALNIDRTITIMAFAVNEFDQNGAISSFEYIIDQNADFEKPIVTASIPATRYPEAVSVYFTITDNKSATTTAYYTTDGTTPDENSDVYVTGDASGSGLSGDAITVTDNMNIRFYVVDSARIPNERLTSFYYRIGDVPERTREDFREETVYFLMTARFYDGDPDNTRISPCYESSGNADYDDPSWRGDFKGLIEKLDYIKALGFTAIWITPPVLNRNYYDYHGYHGWDFTSIDGRLESAGATYQDLIDEIHARDMKIMQDIVLNHSGRYGLKDQSEIKYWGDRDDPEWGKDAFDYYDEYNPDFEYDGVSIEPKSGKSWYNGDLWTKDFPEYITWEPTDEYYWWNGESHSHQNDPDLWGVASPYHSPEGYQIYHFQWPGMYESQFVLQDPEWFHNFWLKNWEDYSCQLGTIHEDCLDLNTESTVVQDYLIDAYSQYIQMGVDAFRIDTVKHISRNTFNRRFNPAFHEAAANAGNDNFYMAGEVCVRDHGVWNKGNVALSQPFYTWKERTTYSDDDLIAAKEAYDYETGRGSSDQPTSNNHLLDGNNYRTPDYSQFSGLNVIDFRMHWNFGSASSAFGVKDGDQYTNDATWNLTYVESHDYSPVEVGNSLYARVSDEDAMAENWSLMFTWRGIPTIFYGNEILFKAGEIIDEGPNRALEESGRAYFGDHIEGSVEVSDFGEYSNATGNMAETLNHPLAQHLIRLNRIRHKIPALQKGQYSTEGISGSMAFKKRFTDDTTDSFVLVTISGDSTFSGIPNGTYTDAITGNVKNVTDGTLTATCSGQGNARIYVLDTALTEAPGQIGVEGEWLK